MNSVKFKINYEGETKGRNYTIDDVADDDTIPDTVRARAKNFNTYLSGSVSAPVFVSESGSPAVNISDVQIISVEETPIEGV